MDLVKTFCELVSTPSPSGKERDVALKIKKHLDRMGVTNYFDDSYKKTGCNIGNLIATIGDGKPSITFVSHMDTVEDGKSPIVPVIKGGIIKPKNNTVLGADDKSGVACSLKAIENLIAEKRLPRTTFIFTTNEEGDENPMGIEAFKAGHRIDYAFSIDGSDAPGTFMHKALGTMSFEVWIKGKASHAQIAPDKGANAILAAGLMLTKLKIGKSKSDGSIINVGAIDGGGTTTAVVPDNAHMLGEFGAFDKAGMDRIAKRIEDAAKAAGAATGCTYDIKWHRAYYTPPFKKSTNDRQIQLAKKAAIATGLKFSLMPLNSVSEVNALNGMGINSLAMCRGGRNAHSANEHISIREMEDTAKLITEIVKTAKALG